MDRLRIAVYRKGDAKHWDWLQEQRHNRDRERRAITSKAGYWRAVNRVNAALGGSVTE